MITGTLANAGAIVVGGLVGLVVHSRLPERMIRILFQGIGLVTLTIGISMALRSDNLIVAVLSILLGAAVGQWIDIDAALRRLADRLQGTTAKKTETRFSEGLVTASMLFCAGSMAILGAFEEGLGETPRLLLTKSVMDGISSVAFGATFGVAVLFSSIPVLIYQGTLTLLAAWLSTCMGPTVIADLTSVGGILLMGLGLSIMEIKQINVTNMLPALVVVVLLSSVWP